ncbi:glycosyltransferase [Pseudarthrobacter sp. AL07]|uniref:glycosyltransferase n=1 Tax=unclassified Pseudarthrobacter TaxID=2647000 RepID=UPI00249BCAE4|nr:MULTISPECIES: glycosyltransferase [unclassified Pseudarthrobacter]MDI3193075.1 glycosyltransferase [Pseudarthrobacter sp. AL20]MDI3207105.1 glycosyltransferase [Pseudarthrobacter sp. AL07]
MTSNATTAVVSLFNADERVLANAAALLTQVRRVVVVDDGSSQDPAPVLRQLQDMGCIVERLATNSGIAAALNAGIALELASGNRPSFILTMDQDSLLDGDYVAALEEAALAAEQAGVRVGMVAPATIRGLPTRRSGVVNGVQLGGEPIQSGLLLPVAVLEELGTLQSDLFIDGVDTEYFLRCQSAGFKTVIAPSAALDHSLGSMTPARVFGADLAFRGLPIKVRTAASWRYYYLFRNRILLARKYGRRHVLWAAKGLMADYRHLVIVTLLAPHRFERLAAAAAGIADGLAGRAGKRRVS